MHHPHSQQDCRGAKHGANRDRGDRPSPIRLFPCQPSHWPSRAASRRQVQLAQSGKGSRAQAVNKRCRGEAKRTQAPGAKGNGRGGGRQRALTRPLRGSRHYCCPVHRLGVHSRSGGFPAGGRHQVDAPGVPPRLARGGCRTGLRRRQRLAQANARGCGPWLAIVHTLDYCRLHRHQV